MKLLNPKKNASFWLFNSHLALFHQASDHKEYWKGYWEDGYFSRLVKEAEHGKMGEFENYAFKYFKPEDVILEAGCGPAHIVHGLQKKGFKNVTGIDYEEHVVAEVNKRLPHLKVEKGNILSLDMPDNHLDAYLSFGVVEHFVDGPEPALKEAARVLKHGGIAMISVPYLNPLRKTMMKNVPLAKGDGNHGVHFHQYYFSKEEFSGILQRFGLTVVDAYPYASYAFLTREHAYFARFWSSRLGRAKIVRNFFKRYFYYASRTFRNRYGHMCMFICKVEKHH